MIINIKSLKYEIVRTLNELDASSEILSSEMLPWNSSIKRSDSM